jgi:protein gp37
MMGDKSGIEWTDATWNPVTGCDRVSEGCDHCYAQTLARRLKLMGNPRYQLDGDPQTSGPGFGLNLHPDKLIEPLTWSRPRRIFVNSMSDLFHDDVPDGFIANVFGVMAAAQQHQFQILTKRPGRMASLLPRIKDEARELAVWHRYKSRTGLDPAMILWPLPNVWLGTSVENQRWADIRIPKLLQTPAAVRFLSCEPLLGRIDLHLDIVRGDLAWVIVGGESGVGARPMDASWARSLRDQCVGSAVPFFFKQWGGITPKAGGRTLDERTWDEMPASLDPQLNLT